MTATNLGLNGQPVKFLGALVSNTTSNLGLSASPSTMNVILTEDTFNGDLFEPPALGTFHTIEVGSDYKFSGIIMKYEKDLSNISGRRIRVTINDVRQAMSMAPVIMAPGSEAIAEKIKQTGCSVLDVYGAFQIEFEGLSLDLSGYNNSGMTYENVLTALNGGNVRFGEFLLPVPQQTATVFGETYRFNLADITDVVVGEQRINTNIVPLSNIIEDLSTRHSFDWFIESERASDGIIDVTVRIVDRSFDSTSLELQDFLDAHEDKVVTATSGIELRTEVSCLALQGAYVEQLEKVNIDGMANEPIDLTSESGSNKYIMTEQEMRAVLGGKNSWETWVETPVEVGGGGNFIRYGALLSDDMMQPIVEAATLYNSFIVNKNIPKNNERDKIFLAGKAYANAGKIYEKLKAKAESTYGKRWVHGLILNDIIESAWTRDVVGGNNDPNEYFRQDDGRTRAYVEFSSDDLGLGLSIGGAQAIFGNLDTFRNITAFGTTFSNVTDAESAILSVELVDNFSIELSSIDSDKSNYVYDNSDEGIEDFGLAVSFEGIGTIRTKLFVAATVDKDGVLSIDSPVNESEPFPYELLQQVLHAGSILDAEVDRGREKINKTNQRELRNELRRLGQKIKIGLDTLEDRRRQRKARGELRTLKVEAAEIGALADQEDEEDADGNKAKKAEVLNKALVQYMGTSYFKIIPKCFQPRFAYIPTRSRGLRYGPVFSRDLGPDTQGRLEIIQDDGFAPWEFGSISLMQEAMQVKIDNATSLQKDIFSSNIVVEGFPKFNLGQALGKNANINSITITFGGGVRTSYSLQTFTRKFGELSKEDIATIALFRASSAQRIFAQSTSGFNQKHRFGVNKNFGRGGGGTSTSTGGAAGLA